MTLQDIYLIGWEKFRDKMSNIRIRVKDVENFFLEYPSIEVKRKKKEIV